MTETTSYTDTDKSRLMHPLEKALHVAVLSALVFYLWRSSGVVGSELDGSWLTLLEFPVMFAFMTSTLRLMCVWGAEALQQEADQ